MDTVRPTDIQPSHHPQIVDVREPDEFWQEHIPGSRNIPFGKLDKTASELADSPVILTCRSGRRAAEAKAILESRGCVNVQLLEGGLLGWKAAKKTTRSIKKGFSIMQQVQIIAGCMILAGVFIKPLWFLAPLAGFGLLTAGLTNTCLMASVLGRMPWNGFLPILSEAVPQKIAQFHNLQKEAAMTAVAANQVKPYTALHLQHFPIETFITPSGVEIHPMWSGEGNISYLVVNPEIREAFLIDPDLEILGSYLLTFTMQQLKLVAVIDTHNHAEHATAAPELRQLLGVPYIMHAVAPSSYVSERVADNDEREIAGIRVKFLHTPGHTPHLITLQIDNHIFTGDSLFLKSCGRADFPGIGNASVQFDSLRRLSQLPDETTIHPGHDYNNELSITLGEARKVNKRLQFTDPEAFIRFMDEFYRDNEKPDDWEWYVSHNAR